VIGSVWDYRKVSPFASFDQAVLDVRVSAFEAAVPASLSFLVSKRAEIIATNYNRLLTHTMQRRFSAHPRTGDRPGRNENERDEVLSQQVAKGAAAVIIGFESISL
jgi:hypothetical protein